MKIALFSVATEGTGNYNCVIFILIICAPTVVGESYSTVA